MFLVVRFVHRFIPFISSLSCLVCSLLAISSRILGLSMSVRLFLMNNLACRAPCFAPNIPDL
jgi:hypothetical protein